MDEYMKQQAQEIRQTVGSDQVLLGLSGGVDSSVCAALLSEIIPGQLNCIFVDHGFMRMGEGDEIEAVFSGQDKLRFIRVNAKERFLGRLKGVADPETKRKHIGEEFIRVFEEEAAKLDKVKFLAQGTVHLDVAESGGNDGTETVIKSHHNVGGLPEKLGFKGVIEPLVSLYKEDVRALGRRLQLPESLLNRQPFPGPGLAIRVMGEVTEEKLETLRKADAILREEVGKLAEKPDQYFAVLTDTYSVGSKDGKRTYDPVVAIRAVSTGDFMTCDYFPLDHQVLSRIAGRITGEIGSVSRVVYDITDKPPGTIEWE